MPRGVVRWFDANAGEGRVAMRSRELMALASDVEPAARVAGARVTFDLDRSRGLRAVNVRLRRGGRTSPRQGRFGDLTGSHHPDEKGHRPLTRAHRWPPAVLRIEERPLEVVRLWLRAMAEQDVDQAAHLYTPDAVVHAADQTAIGYRAIHRLLASTGITGRGAASARMTSGPDGVTVTWTTADAREVAVDSRVEHGQIAEQTIR